MTTKQNTKRTAEAEAKEMTKLIGEVSGLKSVKAITARVLAIAEAADRMDAAAKADAATALERRVLAMVGRGQACMAYAKAVTADEGDDASALTDLDVARTVRASSDLVKAAPSLAKLGETSLRSAVKLARVFQPSMLTDWREACANPEVADSAPDYFRPEAVASFAQWATLRAVDLGLAEPYSATKYKLNDLGQVVPLERPDGLPLIVDADGVGRKPVTAAEVADAKKAVTKAKAEADKAKAAKAAKRLVKKAAKGKAMFGPIDGADVVALSGDDLARLGRLVVAETEARKAKAKAEKAEKAEREKAEKAAAKAKAKAEKAEKAEKAKAEKAAATAEVTAEVTEATAEDLKAMLAEVTAKLAALTAEA